MRSVESEAGWTVIDDVDVQTATFPLSVRVDGKPVWVFRSETEMFGVQDECPHTLRTLGTAKLLPERGMIRCIYHNYTFRLSDGGGVNCPGYTIDVYDAKVDGGKLHVRPRQAAS